MSQPYMPDPRNPGRRIPDLHDEATVQMDEAGMAYGGNQQPYQQPMYQNQVGNSFEPQPGANAYRENQQPYQQPYQQPVYQNQSRNSFEPQPGANAYRENQQPYQQQPVYRNQVDNNAGQQAESYEDKNLQRANARYWITAIVYFILGVLEVIMGLRFVFRLLGASQNNSFITFLYNLSHAFVAPFNGIFNDQAIGNVSVFELSTIIAMLIYALVAWGLVSLGRMLFASTYNSQMTRRR